MSSKKNMIGEERTGRNLGILQSLETKQRRKKPGRPWRSSQWNRKKSRKMLCPGRKMGKKPISRRKAWATIGNTAEKYSKAWRHRNAQVILTRMVSVEEGLAPDGRFRTEWEGRKWRKHRKFLLGLCYKSRKIGRIAGDTQQSREGSFLCFFNAEITHRAKAEKKKKKV